MQEERSNLLRTKGCEALGLVTTGAFSAFVVRAAALRTVGWLPTYSEAMGPALGRELRVGSPSLFAPLLGRADRGTPAMGMGPQPCGRSGAVIRTATCMHAWAGRLLCSMQAYRDGACVSCKCRHFMEAKRATSGAAHLVWIMAVSTAPVCGPSLRAWGPLDQLTAAAWTRAVRLRAAARLCGCSAEDL